MSSITTRDGKFYDGDTEIPADQILAFVNRKMAEAGAPAATLPPALVPSVTAPPGAQPGAAGALAGGTPEWAHAAASAIGAPTSPAPAPGLYGQPMSESDIARRNRLQAFEAKTRRDPRSFCNAWRSGEIARREPSDVAIAREAFDLAGIPTLPLDFI